MENIKKIKKIKNRPALYIGNLSLERLLYLAGYEHACDKLTNRRAYFDSYFRLHVRIKYIKLAEKNLWFINYHFIYKKICNLLRSQYIRKNRSEKVLEKVKNFVVKINKFPPLFLCNYTKMRFLEFFSKKHVTFWHVQYIIFM